MPRRGISETVGDPDDSHATRSSLIRRLHDWKDEGGWQEFFDTYWKLIYAVAIRSGLSDSEAQDVVQETVVCVARQLREGRYDKKLSAFKTWLYTITRRRIIDHLRKRVTSRSHITDSDSDPSEGTDLLGRIPHPANLDLETMWEAEWQKNLLDAAIDRVRSQVSPKQFQVFDLSVLRQVSTAEITKLLNVSAAQVYLARHRVGSLVKKEFRRLERLAETQAARETS